MFAEEQEEEEEGFNRLIISRCYEVKTRRCLKGWSLLWWNLNHRATGCCLTRKNPLKIVGCRKNSQNLPGQATIPPCTHCRELPCGGLGHTAVNCLLVGPSS